MGQELEPIAESKDDLQRVVRQLGKKLRRERAANDALKLRLRINHERWKNIWAGWQSLAVVVGLIAAGIWTFTTFSDTRQREAAELQYSKLKLSYEQESSKHIAIDLGATATQLTFPQATATRRIVRIDVGLTRIGNWIPEDSHLDLKNATVETFGIENIAQDGTISYYRDPRKARFQYGPLLLTKADVQEEPKSIYPVLQKLPAPATYVTNIKTPAVINKKDHMLTAHVIFVLK